MFTKITIFISLLLLSFSVSSCGGENSSLAEDLILIIAVGLILACFFLLPLSVIMFNTKKRSSYIAWFSGYFFSAVFTITAMFYASNDVALVLSLFLCIFCALPTFHTLYLAYKSNIESNEKEQT